MRSINPVNFDGTNYLYNLYRTRPDITILSEATDPHPNHRSPQPPLLNNTQIALTYETTPQQIPELINNIETALTFNVKQDDMIVLMDNDHNNSPYIRNLYSIDNKTVVAIPNITNSQYCDS